MLDDAAKTKINLQLEEYRTVSTEVHLYIQESFRCFMYAAILGAIYLGRGGAADEIHQYIPYGFVLLVLYYFSIYYLGICLSRYRAKLEKDLYLIRVLRPHRVLCL